MCRRCASTAAGMAAWKDADTARLQLLAEVLAGSKSARLDKRLVYEKGMATSVSAGATTRAGRHLHIVVTVKPGADRLDVEREVDPSCAELLAKGPTAEELARVKATRPGRLLAQPGAPGRLRRPFRRAGREHDLRRHRRMPTWRAWSSWRKPPGRGEGRRQAGCGEPLHDDGEAVCQIGGREIDLTARCCPRWARRPTSSSRHAARQLKNGLKVMLLERHSAPIVNVALALDAGALPTRRQGRPCLADARTCWTRAPSSATPSRCRTRWKTLGARLAHRHLVRPVAVRLQATAANLAPSLQLLAEAALTPTFPQDQVRLARTRRLAQIGQEKAQPNSLAMRVMPALLYGADHAYGKSRHGLRKNRREPSRATTWRSGTPPGSVRAAQPWSSPATPRWRS
jgi:zinc protease